MADLFSGAAIGAVFGELLKLVIDTAIQVIEFQPLLRGFERTLKTIEPSFVDIDKLSNRSVGERTILRGLLDEGKKLVVKCSSTNSLNLIMIKWYTGKLTDLDNDLCKFFHIEASVATLAGINALLDRNRPFESCGVPELPEFVTGLDQHLEKLKKLLLKDTTRVLVVSAPGGFGKTTLANMLCHDNDIKGKFDNILYLTVSTGASFMSLAKSLLIHYGINNYEFRNEQDAKNQIKNLLKQRGSGNLLVLDDVWSESLIGDLMVQTSGFKILATSRFLFKKFNSTYELNLLNAESAKTLFCYHAFVGGSSPVNSDLDDLIDQVVAFCKGIPLALIVVGASLCGEPEVTWISTLLQWSEGQSILESHEQLLLCLQTSIDTLSELHKDCFLDLGLFPEDDQITGTTLMDMWVELYNLDDARASDNLNKIKSRNLVNLVPIRKAAGEPEGHCSHYRVTQHDMLRELAIHLSRQESEADRKRMFIEIPSNNFPEWWTQGPIAARILSISTGKEFSSTWNDDLNAPNVEVLILNIRSENYKLPEFIKKMSKLKVLIVTGYGVYPTQLNNLQVLASLSKLHRIRFEHVSVSPFIQAIFTLKTLKKITFVMCKIGDALSSGTAEYPYTLENLKYLGIDLCYDLKELPAGLCSSVRLQKLVITNCQELDSLPNDLGNLSNLEILSLHCCTKLKALPKSIRSLRKLRVLDVSDCSDITALPEQTGELSSLQAIDISGCEGLETLPQSLAGLDKLKIVTCDEERSHLWKNIIESHPGKVKMNLVEEDRSETFKKIYY